MMGARSRRNINILKKNLAAHSPRTRVQPTTETNGRSRRLMKKIILVNAVALVAGTLLAAESDDVKAAAKKLAGQDNYSWKTTVVVPEGSQFRPGPTEGKTEKDGFTWLSMSFQDNTMDAVVKGEKGAAKVDSEWRSLSEMRSEEHTS